MSDIKLFRLGEATIELQGGFVQVEKSLQTTFEANLEVLLGVRFLKSEHTTGPVHGGRIDTLGIDEDGTPVIIEYKRSINENVINQGLFYLDWLLDHRKDFQWLVMEKLGQEAAVTVDWSSPRLLCIAGDFTRYDTHAVKQIARNIELIRYRRFGSEFLMIELVHAPTQTKTVVTPAAISEVEQPAPVIAPDAGKPDDKYKSSTIAYRVAQSSPELLELFNSVKNYLTSLGEDVQIKEVKYYIAFKRIKNFASLEVYPQAKVIFLYLKIDPGTIVLEQGFTRDVSKIGHFGTGNLEVSIRSKAEFEKAQSLMAQSYAST